MKRYFCSILMTCAVAVAPLPAKAGPREDVMSAAAKCFALTDDRAWLDCYLKAAQPMQSALGVSQPARAPAPLAFESAPPTAPEAATRPAPPTSPPRSGSSWFGLAGLFGSETPKTPENFGHKTIVFPSTDQNIDHITARLVKYTFTPRGYFTIVLDNGQVWQQMEGDDAVANLKLPAGNYVATIKTGFFGSYNLTIKGVTGLFRVGRLN